ncbi:FK506-binding protein 15-like isoform X2 [Maniola hyperantus]|uniref:FK506-binding protein 15-like isoform X2 n=1 Tax=Aphantopus hyperantus TaxID=2795564 RepID=UPI0037481CB1
MSKCDLCKKSITKSMPGVECSKCERIVHLNTRCSGLSNKQIAALKAASSLEWTCLECQRDTPRRNSSVIIPEDDEEEDETPVQINAKKLLSNITKEVEKAIKNEMRELNESLQFHSAKLDEVVECIDAFKQTIKALERKNVELTNKNNNLETRVGALEQRLQEIEQEKLTKYIEIANVPYQSTEVVSKLVEKVALMLKQPLEGIKSTRRLQGKGDQPAIIKVELKDEEVQDTWIAAAKKTKTTVADICPSERSNNNIVYIREAMTKTNKTILWEAKQELKSKQNFKYLSTVDGTGVRKNLFKVYECTKLVVTCKYSSLINK